MQIFRKKRPTFGLSGDGTQVVALSLFMLLLAFFIMMNSNVTLSPQRISAVIESVQTAFGQSLIEINTGSSLIITSQQRHGTGNSMADVAAAFANEVPGMKQSLVKRTGVLTMVIPLNEFNRLLDISGTGKTDQALQQIITFLSDPERKYEVQLFLNRRPERFHAAPLRTSPTDTYLSIWSKRLLELGLPSERFSYGIAPGPAGTVSLVVKPTEETPPQSVKPSPSVVSPYSTGVQ